MRLYGHSVTVTWGGTHFGGAGVINRLALEHLAVLFLTLLLRGRKDDTKLRCVPATVLGIFKCFLL